MASLLVPSIIRAVTTRPERREQTEQSLRCLGLSLVFYFSPLSLSLVQVKSRIDWQNRLMIMIAKETCTWHCSPARHISSSPSPHPSSSPLDSSIDASSSLSSDIYSQPGYDDGKFRCDFSSLSSRSSHIRIQRREKTLLSALLHTCIERLSAARMPMRKRENKIHLQALQR